ncbi:acyl-CoA reductase [Mycobacterium sp. pUA109]|uniref:acyl-CoA reductase n=1 Tax=Mycobacterium sp. pUA109 TaxID=3238982 RepID=UPI00351B6124
MSIDTPPFKERAANETSVVVPALIRGQLIETDLVEFGGRQGGGFSTPNPAAVADRLPLRDPGALADVHALSFADIQNFLAELGERLRLSENRYLQDALKYSAAWSDLTPPLVRSSFEQLPGLFAPQVVREIADRSVPVEYLDGWVEHRLTDGRVASIRAMGARAVHIIAGNSPLIAAFTIVRNAVTRSDAIIKTPSNDPLTALAIGRTMVDFAPEHPITRHLSIGYWRGGDTEIEQRLYRPAHIEKIIAWGGLASVRHVVRYIRPGLELVTLDPKRSATIVGPAAFASEETLRDVARRAATDVGALNQVGCVNARVIYVATGIEPAGLERANAFGAALYEEMQRLPESLSTKPRTFDAELRANIDALRAAPDWYQIFGGAEDEGAVIVSQLDEAVEFHRALACRVANVVPVSSPEDVLPRINAYTQTVGVYPEELKLQLRDKLALYGGQRLISLGYAAHANYSLPQDGIEPVRRMVRWIVDERCDPAEIPPLWDSRPGG